MRYAKEAAATAFVQEPEVFDTPYKVVGGESGDIVGMFEVIESNFAGWEADHQSIRGSFPKGVR